MSDGDPLSWETTPPFEGYDIAQVCTNGHVATSMLISLPSNSKFYCPTCGAPTISSCPQCRYPIRGSSPEIFVLHYSPPRYCEHCGIPYPWTEQSLEVAKVLARELEGLSEDDRVGLENSLPDLAADTPKTPVAIMKVKRILTKLGEEAYSSLVKVLTDLATEAVKKQLGF